MLGVLYCRWTVGGTPSIEFHCCCGNTRIQNFYGDPVCLLKESVFRVKRGQIILIQRDRERKRRFIRQTSADTQTAVSQHEVSAELTLDGSPSPVEQEKETSHSLNTHTHTFPIG